MVMEGKWKRTTTGLWGRVADGNGRQTKADAGGDERG